MRRVVIVGGGLGGLRTAESLRRDGFDGSITIVGAEDELPYDRPPLSKDVLLGRAEAEQTTLRPAERLEELAIEVRVGAPAVGLDVAGRRVLLERGEVEYDEVVLATGSAARRISAFDHHPAVTTLRTMDDARRIRAGLEHATRLVVLGGGFIGGEVAAAAHAHGVEVTIVEQEPLPMEQLIGPLAAGVVAELHRAHGTTLRLGTSVASVEGDDAGLRLRLTDGDELAADLMVLGIGAVPNTGWLDGSGLALDGGLVCDASLRAAPGVHAVGDIVTWPNELYGRTMRVEHWTNAGDQARHVARQLMQGGAEPYRGSNYFWSDQYGSRIQFAGLVTDDAEVVRGDGQGGPTLIWFRAAGRPVGVFALDAPAEFAAGRRAVESSASWDEAVAALEAAEARRARA